MLVPGGLNPQFLLNVQTGNIYPNALISYYQAIGAFNSNPGRCVIDKSRNQVWKNSFDDSKTTRLDVPTATPVEIAIAVPTDTGIYAPSIDRIITGPGSVSVPVMSLPSGAMLRDLTGTIPKAAGGGNALTVGPGTNVRLRALANDAAVFAGNITGTFNAGPGCYDGIDWFCATDGGIVKTTTVATALWFADANIVSGLSFDASRNALWYVRDSAGIKSLRRIDLTTLAVTVVVANIGAAFLSALTAVYDTDTDTVAVTALGECKVYHAATGVIISPAVSVADCFGGGMDYWRYNVYGNGPQVPPNTKNGSIVNLSFGLY